MGKGKQKLNPYMIFINEQVGIYSMIKVTTKIYCLLIQKKRVQPEWNGKSNPELVVLCDPLWTSLTDA